MVRTVTIKMTVECLGCVQEMVDRLESVKEMVDLLKSIDMTLASGSNDRYQSEMGRREARRSTR